jgi:acyl-CoA synthetase (AMP-forming)/AMP-acid ligase II
LRSSIRGTRRRGICSLSARLPRYLIPVVIHLCESLPLSLTGKVDRRALLALHDAAGAGR